MRGVTRRIGCALVVALVLPACAPDGAAPAPPQEGTTDDLGAVRLRNFNFGRSINKGLGQATGAIQDGANAVGGAFSTAFAEATSETNKAGRTAMSSVVSTAEHQWRNASGQVIDGAGNLIAAIPLNWLFAYCLFSKLCTVKLDSELCACVINHRVLITSPCCATITCISRRWAPGVATFMY